MRRLLVHPVPKQVLSRRREGATTSSRRRLTSVSLPIATEGHRAHAVFGANTDVGKSVVSAGLVRAAASFENLVVNYIKPLQCGGSDESFVHRHFGDDHRGRVESHTLFNWDTPASPHLASRLEGAPVSDKDVLRRVIATLDVVKNPKSSPGDFVTILETAGGVLSPSSSSPQNKPNLGNKFWGWSTQADLYSSLGLPVVFVGDGRLGGISVTLSSLEALWSRGYKVDAIVFIEGKAEEDGTQIKFGQGNTEALREYMSMRGENEQNAHRLIDKEAIVCLPELPPMPLPLDTWYENNHGSFIRLHNILNQAKK